MATTRFQKGMIPWNKGKRKIKTCSFCQLNFSGRGVKYCSLQCAGRARLGMVFSKNLGRKKGCIPYNKGKKSPETSGDRNGKWISDRTKLAKRQERNDMAYKEWRKQVWVRDNYKCKIGNCDCKGKIIAHHILGWSLFPELRYEVNNGITLCQFHHPLKRNDEKKLSPYFQELVGVKVN